MVEVVINGASVDAPRGAAATAIAGVIPVELLRPIEATIVDAIAIV